MCPYPREHVIKHGKIVLEERPTDPRRLDDDDAETDLEDWDEFDDDWQQLWQENEETTLRLQRASRDLEEMKAILLALDQRLSESDRRTFRVFIVVICLLIVNMANFFMHFLECPDFDLVFF